MADAWNHDRDARLTARIEALTLLGVHGYHEQRDVEGGRDRCTACMWTCQLAR